MRRLSVKWAMVGAVILLVVGYTKYKGSEDMLGLQDSSNIHLTGNKKSLHTQSFSVSDANKSREGNSGDVKSHEPKSYNDKSREKNSGKDMSYLNRELCEVNCEKGVPCEYKDEVDLRIIVLTYNRPESLRKCLEHVSHVDTLGDKVSVDIWIDRDKNGSINKKTQQVAQHFKHNWTRGRACVHEQKENAFIMGQWIYTWRPRVDTEEIALFIEDDIDLSIHAYRWLKSVQKHFHNLPDISGYSLQMENVKFVEGKMKTASGPKSDPVFLHYIPNTWGFSPHPKHWRNFQDWFHEKRKDKSFHPYMPGTVINQWFRNFEKQGTQDAHWDMWEIYYFYHNNLFTVLSNLLKFTGRRDVLLDTNRMEPGLHFGKGSKHDNSANLMKKWDPSYVKFPSRVTRYGLGGVPVNTTVTG